MKLWSSFAALFRKEKLDAEMSEEMRLHLERRIDENIAAGMAPQEARYAALRKFGEVEQVKERCREQRGFIYLEQLGHDVRHAVRQLRKTPGFTAVAVLSLGLAIGANTAVFSLVDEVLLKLLPVKNPHELVVLRWDGNVSRAEGNFNYTADDELDPATKQKRHNGFSLLAFERFQARSAGLAEIFAFAPLLKLNAIIDGEPEVIAQGQVVSGNYHAALGVSSVLGRVLTPTDDLAESAPVAVISHRYWQRRFGGQPGVVGKTVLINDDFVTIVGVTPAKFAGTLQVGDAPDITLPLVTLLRSRPDGIDGKAREGGTHLRAPWYWWLRLMGRLQPGVAAQKLQAALDPVFQDEAAQPDPNARLRPAETKAFPPHIHVMAGGQGLDEVRRLYRHSLLVLGGLVGLVLCIACLNVANLLLARGERRRKEIALRLALGATRSRIARQLLVESLLLALLGAALGTIFAGWTQDILLGLRPVALRSLRESMFVLELGLDWRALGFAAGIALATALAFGMVPALHATRVNLSVQFQGGTHGLAGRSGARLGKILLVGQVALSLSLLIGAGLFTRTLRNLERLDGGINRRHVLFFSIDGVSAKRDRATTAKLYERVKERIAAVGGVRAVTFSGVPVLNREREGAGITVPGRPEPPGQMEFADFNYVDVDFFKTLEIPILFGRSFDARDTLSTLKISVVNQAMARKYFGSENPVGRKFYPGGEVIGVVRDAIPDDVRNPVEPTAYVPFRQNRVTGPAYFAVRMESAPFSIIAAIREAARDVDPTLALFDVHTFDQQIGRLLQQDRLLAKLSGFLGALAIVLVCVGLYGMMSYEVVCRMGEIGIRMALGAAPSRVLRMVLRESLTLVGAGIVLGLFAAWAGTRLIASMLYGLSPTNPFTYGAVMLLLIVVALLACWLPARRAAKVDPMVALRCE